MGALAWLVAAEIAVRVLPFSTLSGWMECVPPSRSHAASDRYVPLGAIAEKNP